MKYRLKIGKRIGIIEYDTKEEALKRAEYFKAHGIFTSFDDFYDRCKSRTVTSRVIQILKEQGALEFRKQIYINRVTKYNSMLYAKSNQ